MTKTASNPWVGLSFLLLAVVFRLANATITSVELPAFESEFDVSGPVAELSLTLFLAIAGALVAPIGTLADKFGRVRVFTVGTVLMILANIITAVAPTFQILMMSRVLEAVAFAAMGAAGLALVARAFPDHNRRNRAFALYGASFGMGLALAAVLGGFFAEVVSWRWSFAMNVPILIAAMFGVRYSFNDRTDRDPSAQFDLVGTLLLLGTVIALLLGLQLGPTYAWSGAILILPLSLPFLAAALFWWERRRIRRGERVFLDPQLMRSPGFSVAVVVSFLMMFVAYSVLTVMPIFWTVVGNADAFVVGAALMSLGVGWVIGSILSAPVGTRYGAKNAVVAGLAAGAVALVASAWLLPTSGSPLSTIMPIGLLGLGLGIAYSRVNEAGLRDVSPQFTGLGSGVLISARLIAGALGAMLFAQALLLTATNTATNAIESYEPLTSTERSQLAGDIRAASRGNYGGLVSAESQSRLTEAAGEIQDDYTDATRWTLLAMAAFLGIGALTARRLPDAGRTGSAVSAQQAK